MNAYELAKQLEEKHAPYEDDAANMLRQQEGELEYYKIRDSSHIKIIKAMADRIAELEKEVKRLVGAEPITHGRLTFCKNCGQQHNSTIIFYYPLILFPQRLKWYYIIPLTFCCSIG